ncbi:hypothetical protein CR513_35707, partial [Mucuna pruriens]
MDAQTEVVNRNLSQLLRYFVGKSLKSWVEWLPYIEFADNKVVNNTTSHIPFELIYGFNSLSPLDLLPLPSVASIINRMAFLRPNLVNSMLKFPTRAKRERHLKKVTWFGFT